LSAEVDGSKLAAVVVLSRINQEGVVKLSD